MVERIGKGVTNTEYKWGFRPAAIPSPIIPDLGRLQQMLGEVKDLADLVRQNIKRDHESARLAAQRLREYAKSISDRGISAQSFTGQPGQFNPGALPGFNPTQPQQPTQPQAPQQWPQQPQQAMVNPNGWTHTGPTPPSMWPQQPQAPQQPQQWPQVPQQQVPAQQWPQQPAQPPQQPVTNQSPPWTPPTPPVAQAPSVPQMAQPTPPPAKPDCYKQFLAKNGNDPAMVENPRDAQCKTCVYRHACAFESTAA